MGYIFCRIGLCRVVSCVQHPLQWEVIKVKFLIISNITLTVLNLHQKTDPKVQQDFKGQGHYDKVTTTRSKVKLRSYHNNAHL